MSSGDFCPIVQDECLRDRCKFWHVEEIANSQTGERKLVHDCIVIHLYMLSRQGVVETIRQIATTDKVAASTDRVSEILVHGLTARRFALKEG